MNIKTLTNKSKSYQLLASSNYIQNKQPESWKFVQSMGNPLISGVWTIKRIYEEAKFCIYKETLEQAQNNYKVPHDEMPISFPLLASTRAQHFSAMHARMKLLCFSYSLSNLIYIHLSISKLCYEKGEIIRSSLTSQSIKYCYLCKYEIIW